MRPTHLFLLALFAGCGTPATVESDPEVVSLDIEAVAASDAAREWFDRVVRVFGMEIYAAPETPEAKLLHAAAVAAEYIDNNEDGAADDPLVAASLAAERATLVMFATFDDLENSTLFEGSWVDGRVGQDLAAEETNRPGGFDASLEEVLHLVHNAGHAQVYPSQFGMEGPSALTEAMDLARGGHFDQVPVNYPQEAWFHYDDVTCDYACMATEYAYWAQTSLLGAQASRCAEIAVEWELCTPEQVRAGDPAVTRLLTETVAAPMTVLPDGVYPNMP